MAAPKVSKNVLNFFWDMNCRNQKSGKRRKRKKSQTEEQNLRGKNQKSDRQIYHEKKNMIIESLPGYIVGKFSFSSSHSNSWPYHPCLKDPCL